MAEILTISALNTYVRSLLEGDVHLQDIAVRGEISNYSRHYKTGHCYFTLKDEKSSVKAVMFSSAAAGLSFRAENGMRVIARGRASLFERDGAFQLYVGHLFPEGVGSAQMAFEQLRARLEAEGLFAPEAKKHLPRFPRCIGLVTSKNGAALQDVVKVAARRCPTARFLLAPVSVQGAAAAGEIARAIQALDADGRAEVILVTRGGGSAEDLGVFNEEAVARAAWGAQVPVVSAVGHEVDYTILDFVADLRAPTPSAAAEMILPDLTAAMENALHIYGSIQKNIHFRNQLWYNELLIAREEFAVSPLAPRLNEHRLSLDKQALLVRAAQEKRMRADKLKLAHAAQLAHSLSPYGVLARGYALVRNKGILLRRASQAQPGDRIDIQFSEGELEAQVKQVKANNPR